LSVLNKAEKNAASVQSIYHAHISAGFLYISLLSVLFLFSRGLGKQLLVKPLASWCVLYNTALGRIQESRPENVDLIPGECLC
jgi:hypothetical protein